MKAGDTVLVGVSAIALKDAAQGEVVTTMLGHT
jgi:hypothetical protein